MRGIDNIDKEIEQFLEEGVREVMVKMAEAGEAAVQYNVEHGDYKNRTWNLRRSNYYEVERDSLVVGNSADYASNVESRGYMVCTEGALLAERMLNDGN